jgi:hypothetical protein
LRKLTRIEKTRAHFYAVGFFVFGPQAGNLFLHKPRGLKIAAGKTKLGQQYGASHERGAGCK